MTSTCPEDNRGDIPPSVADRGAFQADKTELSSQILLWRKRKRHQNPDMGNSHRKPVAFSLAKQTEKAMELLRARYNNTDCADVLPESRKVPQPTRCGPEYNARRGLRITSFGT